jgi:hypothetical protein
VVVEVAATLLKTSEESDVPAGDTSTEAGRVVVAVVEAPVEGKTLLEGDPAGTLNGVPSTSPSIKISF